MTQAPPLDLTSLDTYGLSCLRIARDRLGGFASIPEIEAAVNDLNAYPNLDHLEEPRGVYTLDPEDLSSTDLDRARRAVLEGRIFWEHTAAGEATRLRLGTKYLISPRRDITIQDMADRLGEELEREVPPSEILEKLETGLEHLLPLDLGTRHLLQLSFDLSNLARESGLDPAEVLARQTVLLILNEKTETEILTAVRSANFMGLARENFLFMVQPSFPGIAVSDGVFFFDPASPRRLHNHGQLVMQETMDHQIFRLDENGGRELLKADEFALILDRCLDKISYNIEDLDYLTGSINWSSLALALGLGEQGFHMVMEIVANDPDRPIKGGLAAYDQVLGRNVMIESFQLKGLPNEEIKYLNKNFNHYTNPLVSWRALQSNGLPMPVTVKGGYLYYQPVQGDTNFLVKTALVQRRRLKPIRAWKSASNSPAAINAMWAQDQQPGFREFAEQTLKTVSVKGAVRGV